MRHPITKYAVAAVLVVTVLVGLTLFHTTGNITWAIEQSIEALSKRPAVLVEGSASDGLRMEGGSLTLRPMRMWAVANADQTAVEKFRDEAEGVTLLTTDGHKTLRYDPKTKQVTIENRPYVASECWVGSGFLAQLKAAREAGIITTWQETSAKDPTSGQPRIVLKIAWLDGRWNGPRSMRLEFDPQTKLPVSIKQWENAHWEDPASLVIDKITYYESLPDDVFQLQIPAGATVVEK